MVVKLLNAHKWKSMMVKFCKLRAHRWQIHGVDALKGSQIKIWGGDKLKGLQMKNLWWWKKLKYPSYRWKIYEGETIERPINIQSMVVK